MPSLVSELQATLPAYMAHEPSYVTPTAKSMEGSDIEGQSASSRNKGDEAQEFLEELSKPVHYPQPGEHHAH